MGIKNLTNFIKKKYNTSIEQKPITELISKTICIDTPCLIYKLKFSNNCENPKNWVNNFIYFIIKLLNNNTNMWFIMEGTSPVEKKNTQEQRSISKIKLINRTNYLKNLLINFFLDNIITEEIKSEWEKIKPKDSEENFNPSIFEKKIKKRELYSGYVTTEDYNLLKQILDVFDIPYIYSENEAETLCAYLNNKIDFVYSHDSDVLAYINSVGFINNLNFTENVFTFINKKKLLDLMNLDNEKFIDFCILCGTDYNTTVKKIGITTAFKLISENNKIENLNFNKEEFDLLNIKWIRDKFNLIEFNKTESYNFPFRFNYLNIDLLNTIVEENNINLYSYVKEMIDFYIEIQLAKDLIELK